MGRLADKVVLITGGGGAIARGLVTALAKQGAAIAVADFDAERGAAAAKECEAQGMRAISLQCDLTSRAQIDAAVAETVANLGRLDVLVNSATGVTLEATNLPFMEHDEATLDRILAVDLKGTFHCMQACFPHFEQQGGGRVINFSSGAGTERMAGFAAYAAAKEGIRALTGVAAREWGALGITVNVICPSAMTPGLQIFLDTHPDPNYREQAIGDRPIRRLGDPETDIGSVVVFLASDESAYLTGQTFWVDGGGSIHA